jgi:hypothetical protein
MAVLCRNWKKTLLIIARWDRGFDAQKACQRCRAMLLQKNCLPKGAPPKAGALAYASFAIKLTGRV